MPVNCVTLILNGSILTGLTCTWTNVIGLYFYAVMLAVFEIAIAVKYDNIMVPAMLGLFVSVLMINYMPPAMILLPIIMAAANFGAILYSRFLGGD